MHYNKFKKPQKKIKTLNDMLESIEKDPLNSECYECGASDPEYISVNNGIFLCRECVRLHLQLPDEITLIVDNDINTLTENEIKHVYFGGNRKLYEFINNNCPKLNNYERSNFYSSMEMKYYRDTLAALVEEDDRADEINNTFNYTSYPMTEKRTKFFPLNKKKIGRAHV